MKALVSCLVLILSAVGMAQEDRFDLSVTFVGEKGPRGDAFLELLSRHFREVKFHERSPDTVPMGADVVVLDWPQGDPKPLRSPLGKRDDWTTPTVLIGSAGHCLAAPWQVRGGSG